MDATPAHLAWTHVAPPVPPKPPTTTPPSDPVVPVVPPAPTVPQPTPRPSAPPVPSAPGTDWARSALLSIKPARRGAITITYRLTRAGRVAVSGSAAGRRSHAMGSAMAPAGTSRLTLRPTPALLTALRAGHSRRVRVVFTLNSLTRRSTVVRTVTLRPPHAR